MNRRNFATRLSFLAAAFLPNRVMGHVRAGPGETGQGKQVVGQGADKTQAGVYGVNFHGGDGVSGQSDSGRGVWGDSNSGAGVYGRSTHSFGVSGESESSIGVVGKGNIGVRAVGKGPNTSALEISNGAIKVTGAGVGTNTAVFKHVKTASNSFYYNDNHNNGGFTIIDNSYANGDPNAIIFITRDGTGYLKYEPIVTVLYYDSQKNPPSARNHWVIHFQNHDLDDGAKLNVMVIKP